MAVKVTVLIIANTLNLGATILHLLITKRHEFSYFCGLMFTDTLLIPCKMM